MGFHPYHYCKRYKRVSGKVEQQQLLFDDNSWVNFYQHSGVSFQRPGDGQSIKFSGHSFLFNISSVSYYHGLIDVLGQYLLLKDVFPDIRPVFMSTPFEHNIDSEKSENKISGFMRYVSELLGAENIYSVQDYNEISFELLTYIVNHEDYFLYYALPNIRTQDQSFHPPYQRECAIRSRKFLIAHTKKINGYPKKVFVESKLEKMNGHQTPDIIERQFNHEDYYSHVDFFRSKGFVTIDPTSMTMQEQMEYVYNADIVATMTGSNSAHSLYCNDDATFILSSFNTSYRFPHDNLVRICSKNPVIVFDRSKFSPKVFNFDEWSQELSKHIVIV